MIDDPFRVSTYDDDPNWLDSWCVYYLWPKARNACCVISSSNQKAYIQSNGLSEFNYQCALREWNGN